MNLISLLTGRRALFQPMLCAAMLVTVACSARAAQAEGKQWALLIGVEDYAKAAKLQFTANDCDQLAQTLQRNGGLPASRVVQMTDNSEAANQPTRRNILAKLPTFLKNATAGDSVLIYFSGHGFRDRDGKLYLAPLDIDPDAAAETGVPAEWLRDQLAACPAKLKLLVLDACHAGTEKGEGIPGPVTAKDLGDTFKRANGVVTLASSSPDEKSQIWHFKRQSLFTYWLNQGLKGHADFDADGNITIDELYDYTHNHTTQTAEVRFSLPQTPVRIVGPGTAGVPVVVQLEPQPLNRVLADMAEQLAGTMEERSLGKLGVLEFTTDTKLGEMLGADFGILGRYCAERLEKSLSDRAAGKYSVVDRSRMQDALKKQQFRVQDLGNTTRLASLSKAVDGMPVIVRGMLVDRSGRKINLRCKLVQTEGDQTFASVGGTALLDPSEWAMCGRSVELTFDDRRPPAPMADDPVTPPGADDEEKTREEREKEEKERDRLVDRADEKAKGPHPLEDPKFPYRVKVMVGNKERPLVFKKNGDYTEAFVGLKSGEEYSLWVENKTGERCYMKLLVDGLNTLPEKEATKGVETWIWGKRMNMLDARPWVMDPKDATRVNNIPTWAIGGFVTETGKIGQWKRFTVVDAEKSLAARQAFTEQIGVISAAFFGEKKPGGTRGAFGTEAGREEGVDLQEKDGEVGDLLSVVHIKYVDAASLK